ncbi:GntR family transcriptional regulator [Trueperella bialowiezensis]|uniref:HTH-type transcriptional repressor yvoA n=1 Tax=Trueperella bialowiezensis TaxID=312285 RepID=A0A3S4Z4N4_9ACTO|nr:GntR family transcriptional regulator [Trueperella bialowiezensis]VEI12857.1 HTH-type transcriptional repressor yvoA [Trueperella bialowiezensis]
MSVKKRLEPTGAGKPVYVRIAEDLRTRIDDGDIRPGDQLPPEVDLAAMYGVARMTLRQALDVLESEGLIERKRGRGGGTFVCAAPPRIELNRIDGILPQLRKRGQRVESVVMHAAEEDASPEVSHALEIAEGSGVFNVVRLRSVRGVPTLLENSYFPASLFPDLLERDLSMSIYELLGEYDRRPVSKVEELVVARCSAAEKELMGVNYARQLLRIQRVARDKSGAVVEYSEDLMRFGAGRIIVRTEPSE